MAKKGTGVRTRQYNPAAVSLGQYVSALRILKGDMDGDVDAARQTIHDTPAKKRSEFASEIWDRRGRGQTSLLRELFKNPAAMDKCIRSNPANGAAAMSRAFHGRDVNEIVEHDEELRVHAHLAGLGELEEIILENGIELKDFGGAQLASNESGSQLFIVGGDQQVSLRRFEVDKTKESVVLGQVEKIVYVTDKQHLGKADKRSGPYEHTLGEESGEMPVLLYDTVNARLSFSGGRYFVQIDDDGLSPGIRD